jgi:hypothetical protein
VADTDEAPNRPTRVSQTREKPSNPRHPSPTSRTQDGQGTASRAVCADAAPGGRRVGTAVRTVVAGRARSFDHMQEEIEQASRQTTKMNKAHTHLSTEEYLRRTTQTAPRCTGPDTDGSFRLLVHSGLPGKAPSRLARTTRHWSRTGLRANKRSARKHNQTKNQPAGHSTGLGVPLGQYEPSSQRAVVAFVLPESQK